MASLSGSTTSRKTFLGLGLAALGATLVSSGRANPTVDADPSVQAEPAGKPGLRQGAGLYRHKIGDAELLVLSDGAIHLPAWPTFGGPDVTEPQVLSAFRHWHEELPTPLLHVNMLLLRIGGRNILVDTGYGPGQNYRQGGGLLQQNLAANGISTASIDTVLITHAHPDHLWGLFKEGRPLFPNATLLMNKAEPKNWLLSDDQIRSKPERLRPMLLENRKRVEEFLAHGTLIDAETKIAPGLRTLPLPGHTPGHLGLQLDSGGSRLIHCVDAIPHARLHLDHPDWYYGMDSEPQLAVQTRLALLNSVADTDTMLMGCHFPFPALGHVCRTGTGYLFQPETWRWS